MLEAKLVDTSLIPDFGAQAAATKQGNQAFMQGQTDQTSDFLNRYKQAIGGQETTSAMAGRLGSELGLPALNKNAFMLNQAVTNLPQTNIDASRGFDVNQNQLDRMTNHGLQKLSPLAQNATAQAQNAQSSLNTQMGYEQADQAKALTPFNTEQSMLSDRMARETTLYSQQNQQELDGLIAKMNAGVTLSEGEKNRANQLAVAEQQYSAEKAHYDSISSANNKPNTQIVDQGGKKYLIDSGTGQIISTYGSSPGAGKTPNSYLDNSTGGWQ